MKTRVMSIIKLLLEHDSKTTINEVALALGVSNKTIRNDFKLVVQILEDNHLKLVKKAGVGINIEGKTSDKLSMMAEANDFKAVGRKYNSNDRQLYILFQLLNQQKIIKIADLEEELFISRPSVYKDLDKVRLWLDQRDIELVHEARVGFYIKSGEKRIRKAIFDLFISCSEHDELINMFKTEYQSFDFYSYDQKDELLHTDFDDVKQMIKSYEKETNSHFTSEGLYRLTIKYCIALLRMSEGNNVTMSPSTIVELKEHNYYDVMTLITESLSEISETTIGEEEKAYLFGITLGTGTHYEKNSIVLNPNVMTINRIIANQIVEDTKLSYSIIDEKAFFLGLLHHLKTVMNKLKYGLDFHNEHIKEIQMEYPDSYRIAKHCVGLFEELYDLLLPDEEIGYIALHIASAIERSKQPLKVCVVYKNSYSETKLMLEYLHNRYRQMDIQHVLPLSMFNQNLLETYDFIITTGTIESYEHERIVVLPSILLHKDMSQFEILLDTIYERHNDKLLRK